MGLWLVPQSCYELKSSNVGGLIHSGWVCVCVSLASALSPLIVPRLRAFTVIGQLYCLTVKQTLCSMHWAFDLNIHMESSQMTLDEGGPSSCIPLYSDYHH